ncbi:MAG: DNRLRE domain-containing protein, partial [Candidatus Latescibacterota bacterium]
MKTLETRKIFPLFAAVLALAPWTAWAGDYVISAGADGYLEEAAPNDNHGGAVELINRSIAGDSLRSIWRFDISSIPAGEKVVSAVAVFHVTQQDNEPVDVYRVTDGWTEMGANWNNLAGSHDPATRCGAFVPKDVGPVVVEVTPVVREWAEGIHPNNGFMFLSRADNHESRFASREWSAADQRPRLYVKTATIPTMRVTTGGYLGNSSGPRSFTGLGFTPDLVLIKANDNTATVAKSSTMYGNASKELGPGSALLTDGILTLDSDGFTVGSGDGVNQTGFQYFWVAFSAAPGEMEVRSYLGDGTDDRDITGLGFRPDHLIVMAESSDKAMQRYAAHVGDASREFEKSDPKTDRIQAFLDDGFQVGSHNTVNNNKVVYHYAAWNAVPGYIESKAYGGLGNDDRDILGLGFRPEYLFLTAETNTYESVHRFASMTGDLTLRVNTGTVLGNQIQSFLPDGFQVGDHEAVNSVSEQYFYTAFRDHHLVNADLELTMTVDDSLTAEGDTVNFALTLKNAGPSAGSGIEVSDLLPPGLAYSTHSSTQGLYNQLTGVWTVGDLAEGAAAGLLVSATVDPGTAGSSIVNEAKISAVGETDPDETDNAAAATVYVRGVDVKIDKWVNVSSPNEGDSILYHVTVTNGGPDSATGVEVMDRLPAGLTYAADSTTQGGYTYSTGRWSVGTINPGDTARLSIRASVDAGTGGRTITNVAQLVLLDQTDIDAVNDTASVDIVVQSADLGLSKTVDDPTPSEGDLIKFTLELANSGPDSATGVEVTDFVPAGLTYNGHAASRGSYSDVSGVWVVGNIGPGESASLTLDVTVDADTRGWTISNLAAVTASDQADPNVIDNSAFAKITVQGGTFRMATGSYAGDGNGTRSITGTGFQPDVVFLQGNDGEPTTVKTASMPGTISKELGLPSTPYSNVLTSLDPDGFTVSPDGWMNGAGSNYYWIAFQSAPGDIAVGSYSGDGFDDRAIGGVGFTPGYVMILPEWNSEATQRFPAQTGDASLTFGYSAAIPNVIQSYFPDGFVVGSDSLANAPGIDYHYVAWRAIPGITSGDTYSGNSTDNRDFGGLGFQPQYLMVKRDGGNSLIHKPASLTGDAALSTLLGSIVGNTIQALQPDGFQLGSDTAVNESTAEYYWMAFRDATVPEADLEVALSVNDTVPVAADTLMYTITIRNRGPDGANGVRLIDQLPAGLTYSSDEPGQGSYSPATGVWDVGTVLAGASATMELLATVADGTTDETIENASSIIAANQSDPDTTNNSAAISVTVGPSVFRVVSGWYMGDGSSSHPIAGIGFSPDVVLIKGDDGNYPVMRTSTMTGNNSKPIGSKTGFLSNLIESLDPDGFTVGGSNRVNTSGVKYYWTAFRAARPEMVVGDYEGNGLDNRSIPVGFKPEYVVVMNETAEGAVQRFGTQLGDASLFFSSADPVPDCIQVLESDGFQVGRHNATNAVGDSLHFIAWKAVPDRAGSGWYRGNGSDDRDLSEMTFSPNFLLVQREGNGTPGVYRTTAVAGDTSLSTASTPPATDLIQSFLPRGFQVGSSTAVNDSSEVYYWIAFKDDRFVDVAVSMSVDNANPNVGETVQFTVTVFNSGPADASGIRIRDTLPGELTYQSHTPNQGQFSPADGIWSVGSLPVGASADLQLRATVAPDAAGSEIVNAASLWLVDQTDLVAANNSAEVTLAVKSTDLAVTTAADQMFPAVGDTIAYTVSVTNFGPDDATGVVIADTLSPLVTYLTHDAGQGAYDTTSGLWSVGSVPIGVTDTLTVYGRIAAGSIGSYITNVARLAESDVADVDDGNDVDSVTILVPTPVALDDTPNSLFPELAFIGQPVLALRVGVDNPWDVGVQLDTLSTISFTDGIRVYAAALANPTFVPARAANFVLSFESNIVPPAFEAGYTYPLTMELNGTTEESRPFGQAISTAGTNGIYIDQPKMSVDAPVLGDSSVNPGGTATLLALRFENHYAESRTLDSLTIDNAASGPGSPEQLDGLSRSIMLYGDVDGSGSWTPPDTLLATSVFVQRQATFDFGGGWTIPASNVQSLIVVAGVDSVAARDGDRLDAWITSDVNIAFAEPTVFDKEISPLYPLDSYGSPTIDGMVSHQIGLLPVPGDTLYSGANDTPVLTVVVPDNGYEADTLTVLNVKDFSGGFVPADIARLKLYRDDGDGSFDPEGDSLLGDMVYSGDRFEISGLSEPTGPDVVYYVTADVNLACANGNTFRPGIPLDGVTVTSGNDGPLDAGVVSSTSFTTVRVEKIDVAALPLVDSQRPAPGDKDLALLRFEVSNNTLSTITLDSLRLANTTAGAGTQDELDGELDGVHLYVDNGNGLVDPLDTALARNLGFSSGALTVSDIGRPLAPGEHVDLLVACDVDSSCARDGDDLRVRLTAPAAIHFDTGHPVSGAFPIETASERPINGMMPFQIRLYPSADSTAITESADVLVLDLDIPANGYAADTLTSLRVTNFGSANDDYIERVDLWADGGNGTFDKGAGDDLWLESLVSLGARQYQRSGLSHELVNTCSDGNRLFVSCDLKTDYKFSATVQFGVRQNDIGVASGNDGPRGADVVDPSVGIIPKPDEVTVFPYAVGDKRVYPGSTDVLNYGIGLYNGYRNPIILDQVRLLLSGTAEHSDITAVKAYADADTNGLFDPAIDKEIGSAASKDLSFTLAKLGLKLPSEEITYLFVAYDLGMSVSDSVVIDFYVPTASELFFIPSVDTNLSGEFTDSPGQDVTDGMIAAQIAVDAAPPDRAAPGDPRVLAMGLTVPANGALPDRLDYITFINGGTAVAGQDIDKLDLWADGGDGRFDESTGDDLHLSTLVWNAVGWSNPAPMEATIPAGGLRCFVTFSAATSAGDDRTFQAALPA